MPRSTRNGRRLWAAALPGVALVAFVTAIGVGAMTITAPERSTLDGRELTPFARPNATSVEDGSWMSHTEKWLDDHVPSRQRWLEAHARLTRDALRQPVVNDVLVNDPDHFLLDQPKQLKVPSVFGQRAEQLGQAVQATGTPILWVYLPRREEVFDDRLPAAWQGIFPSTRPAYLKAIGRGGPVLDLSPLLSDRQRRESYYWRTDHHWTSQGALAAVDALSQRLTRMGVPIGTDDRTYRTASYPDFYGSLAREVTAGATPQADKFAVQVPDEWRAHVCRNSVCTAPTFIRSLASVKNKYANRYYSFLGGDLGYMRMVNDDPAAHGRVLILKDSFGNALSTYLAERVSSLVAIDERHYNKSENIRDLVKRYRPDVVIVMHNQVSTLGNPQFDSQVWTDMAAVRARRAARKGALAGDG